MSIRIVSKRTDDKSRQPMIGPNLGGPKRCLSCHKLFRSGERWTRYASPPDPKFGSYVIGIHETCAGQTKTTE